MRKPFLAALILSVCLAAPLRAEEAKYYVPPTQFNAAFQVMDQGFSNLFGLFRNGTAVFLFDSGSKTVSRVKIALEAASLTTSNREAAIELTNLFEPRAYPEIAFLAAAPASFKDGRAEIKGTLTIHGQSKPATFEATLNQVGKSSAGGGLWDKEGETVGLSLRGSFKRADFAMGDAPEMPGRFGDAITLMIEMQAIRP